VSTLGIPGSASSALTAQTPAETLLKAFLAGRGPRTLAASRHDLQDFATFSRLPLDNAAGCLIGRSSTDANHLALLYRAHLMQRGVAPATVKRRLAAPRTLVKMGRTLGLVAWELEIDGVRSETYRDTRGPGRTGFARLLAFSAGDTPKAIRDRAILRLLYDLALRRAEVTGVDRADVDLTASRLAVLGKGRTQKTSISLPEPTRQALAAWVAVRGDAPGPLFIGLSRSCLGGRLSGTAVYEIVRRLGNRAGIRATPHGLRHAAITEALDQFGGDVRRVQRFSRHKKLETLLRYDDARCDDAGDIARRVAAGVD
jgi:integrase/recombinase XerC